MTKVIYIAGYGRSGSTILDIVLNAHAQIVGVGELSYLVEEREGGFPCSCGKSYADCEFWNRICALNPVQADFRKIRLIEHFLFLPALLLGLIPFGIKKEYLRYNQGLFDAISTTAGKPIVVDSSKSAYKTSGRFFALKHIANQDVFVIHLIRNGMDTLTSLLVKGSNRALEGRGTSIKISAVRAILGWVIANMTAGLLGRLMGPGRYMCMRYEDFIADPEGSLERIAIFCGSKGGEAFDMPRMNQPFSIGHMTGGNRIRFQKKIVLDREPQQGLRAALTFGQKMLFYILAGWLQILYRY